MDKTFGMKGFDRSDHLLADSATCSCNFAPEIHIVRISLEYAFQTWSKQVFNHDDVLVISFVYQRNLVTAWNMWLQVSVRALHFFKYITLYVDIHLFLLVRAVSHRNHWEFRINWHLLFVKCTWLSLFNAFVNPALCIMDASYDLLHNHLLLAGYFTW